MDRRTFTKICLALLTILRGSSDAQGAQGPVSPGPYPRALLTWPKAPLKASQLKQQENYIFFYPYLSTPCFLLNLGEEIKGGEVETPALGRTSPWPGGVGPSRSLVAYCAICPHLLVYPEQEDTVISYYPPKERAIVAGGKDRLVVCCAHGSAFDPYRGGRIVQPPAEFPLKPIDLEWDPASDQLYAKGVLGLEGYDRFFAAFPKKEREPVKGQTSVVPLAEFSKFVIRC